MNCLNLAALPRAPDAGAPSRTGEPQMGERVSMQPRERVCTDFNAPDEPLAIPTLPSGWSRYREPANELERVSQHTERQKATECLDAWFDEQLQQHQELLLASLRASIRSRLEENRASFTTKLCEETAFLEQALQTQEKEKPVVQEASEPVPNVAVVGVTPGQSGAKSGEVADEAPQTKNENADFEEDLCIVPKNKMEYHSEDDPQASPDKGLTDKLPNWLGDIQRSNYESLVASGYTPEFGPRCSFIQGIVRHNWFEAISTTVIFASAAFVAAELQYIGSQVGYSLEHKEYTMVPDPMWEDFFIAASCITNFVFVSELFLRLIAAQQGALCAPWLWFDFLLVILGLVDLFNSFGAASALGNSGSNLRVAAVRMLRLFRVIRLLRVVRKHTALHSLFLLLKSIRAAIGASIWSFVLLLLIMIISGLIMSQLTHPSMKDDSLPIELRLQLFDHFGTFTKTMVTMFEITTANWVPVVRLTQGVVGETFAYFIVCYRCVFCFAVINVVRAVFMAETFRVASADDDVAMIKRDRAAAFMLGKMKAVFHALDQTGDGLVSWDEFSSMLHDEEVKNFMAILELDVHDCCNVFRILDTDASGGVTCLEFIEGVKHIRGTAKRIDVATLMTVTRKIEKKIDTALAQDTADIERLIVSALSKIESKIEAGSRK